MSVARAPVTATGQADVVRHVKEAWERKDIAALAGLLNPAAVMTADGGGMVGTVMRPFEGGARIAQYMVAIADMAPGLERLERSVNRVPGLVAQRAGVVMTVASFDVSDGRVTRIWAVRNPAKLRPWEGQGLSFGSARRRGVAKRYRRADPNDGPSAAPRKFRR